MRNLAARALGAARRRIAGWMDGAVVLIYHRVIALELDPQLLAVKPEYFSSHMALLAAEYTPLPLGELVRAAQAKRLPDRAVAVTFDDGYADNLHAAEPILREHRIPATVFVATGYSTAGREYWWDELERILLVDDQVPDELELSDERETRRYPTSTDAQRRQAYDDLQPWLRAGPVERREDLLSRLRSWAGESDRGICRESHRPMSIEEVRALDASDVVDVAPHTRRHPCLAMESPEAQRQEIAGSAGDLADWLGSARRGFAYPFGGPRADYTSRTASLVRELGLEFAVSAQPERLTRLSSRWELPRWLVRDWAPDYFERWLAERFSRH